MSKRIPIIHVENIKPHVAQISIILPAVEKMIVENKNESVWEGCWHYNNDENLGVLNFDTDAFSESRLYTQAESISSVENIQKW